MKRKLLVIIVLCQLLPLQVLAIDESIRHYSNPMFGGKIIKPIDSVYAVTVVSDGSAEQLAIITVGDSTQIIAAQTISLPTNLSLNDICVCNDGSNIYVFACGSKRNLTGGPEAWYGRVTVYHSPGYYFFWVDFCYYTLSELHTALDIEAYPSPLPSSGIDVVLIGHRTVFDEQWGQYSIVRVKDAANATPSHDYEVVRTPDMNHRLFELTVTDDYVAVVGCKVFDIQPTLGYIRKADTTLAYNNFDLDLPDYLPGHELRCTTIDGDRMAYAYYSDYYGGHLVVVHCWDVTFSNDYKNYGVPVDNKVTAPELALTPQYLTLLFPWDTYSYVPPNMPSVAVVDYNASTSLLPVSVIYPRDLPSDSWVMSSIAPLGERGFTVAGYRVWMTFDVLGTSSCFEKQFATTKLVNAATAYSPMKYTGTRHTTSSMMSLGRVLGPAAPMIFCR